MTQHYSNPARENDPHALPDIETFEVTELTAWDACPLCTDRDGYPARVALYKHRTEHVGWFYQFGFPGCLPDGEAFGPFDTEADALSDAREGVTDDDESDWPEPIFDPPLAVD